MCLVCKLWNQGKLTAKEADNAFCELIVEGLDDEAVLHAQEAVHYIKNAEELKKRSQAL